MSLNTYSHGLESPIKLKVTIKEAEAYNRVVKVFADNPDGSPADLWKQVDPDDHEIYDQVSQKMDQEMMALGRAVGPDEFTDVYLVKN